MHPIRRAVPEDALSIAELILGEAHHVTLMPDGMGAETVLASMRADAIDRNIRSGQFCYWVYPDAHGHDLLGVLGLREGDHLYQLFVRSDHHHKGLGRALWEQLWADWPDQWQQPEQITVNASPYGLKAYESFGFEAVGKLSEINGIAYIPMRKHLPTSPFQRS